MSQLRRNDMSRDGWSGRSLEAAERRSSDPSVLISSGRQERTIILRIELLANDKCRTSYGYCDSSHGIVR